MFPLPRLPGHSSITVTHCYVLSPIGSLASGSCNTGMYPPITFTTRNIGYSVSSVLQGAQVDYGASSNALPSPPSSPLSRP